MDGTRTVLQAAREAGVRRFLQVSSVMVYGFEIQGELLETAPLRGAGNPYCQTKIDSEVLALQEHRPGEFDVTVIRCGDVYGPGSIPWTIRPVKMMQAGVFTLADGGAGILNHVYVDNLVDGILLAMVSDISGEAFNLTDGEATTCRDFFMHYARMLGRTKLRSAPAFLLRSGLQLNHGFLSVFGLEPRIHPDSIAYVTRRGTYSITKARKLLGYEPRVDLATGMHSTEAWLKDEGLIPTHRSSAS